MDRDLAYRILGLPLSATLEDAGTAYRRLAKDLHPDARRAGSSEDFIVLSAAFSLVKETILGGDSEEAASSVEVLRASKIAERLDASFARMETEYEQLRARTLGWGKEHIRSVVFGAGSGTDLKRAVGSRILRTWSEMISTLESHVQKVIDRSAADQRESLYRLFSDMYDRRRQAWLVSLYRKPVIWACLSIFVALLVARQSQEFAVSYPALAGLAASPFSLVAPIAGALLYVLIQLRLLNPRRQFVPPRFSAVGVETELKSIAKSVQPDLRESTQGAVILFAAIGTVMTPGVGTAIGAGVGLVVGLLSGENLSAAKDRIYGQLSDEMVVGVRQLDSRLLEWMREQRSAIRAAAEESLAANLEVTRGFLLADPRASRRLLAERKLLPPPAARPA